MGAEIRSHFLIVEILIEIGVQVQKLLQICAGIGAGVLDGKASGGYTLPAGEAGDDHPMLAAILICGTEQDGLTLLQKAVNGRKIAVRVGNCRIMTGPVDTARWGILQ